MNKPSKQGNTPSATGPQPNARRPADPPNPDEATQRALDEGDAEKIDLTLEQLHVSTTDSGKDQSHKPDTEGSGSSSKNLGEQAE